MATRSMCRGFSWILPLFRGSGSPCRGPAFGRAAQNVRSVRKSSANLPGKVKPADTELMNSAALEQGVTKYFCNRNPRNPEMLGIAEKPKGFETKRYRVDYYHR